jgi:hypothetical protein
LRFCRRDDKLKSHAAKQPREEERNEKRVFSLFLALCLIVTALGIAPAAAAGLQRQGRDVGGDWANSSFRTPSMSCKITAARDGRQCRCVVTDAYGRTVTSNAATIIVAG